MPITLTDIVRVFNAGDFVKFRALVEQAKLEDGLSFDDWVEVGYLEGMVNAH